MSESRERQSHADACAECSSARLRALEIGCRVVDRLSEHAPHREARRREEGPLPVGRAPRAAHKIVHSLRLRAPRRWRCGVTGCAQTYARENFGISSVIVRGIGRRRTSLEVSLATTCGSYKARPPSARAALHTIRIPIRRAPSPRRPPAPATCLHPSWPPPAAPLWRGGG